MKRRKLKNSRVESRIQTQKRMLLRRLSPDEIRTLNKLNPYRYERDAFIGKLRAKGVYISVLVAATGMSRSSIFRAAHRMNKTS